MTCLRRPILLISLLALAVMPTFAQQAGSRSQATITPNYKDAELAQVIEAVGEITGKNFIIDPRVTARVTMLSSTPMSPSAFYEAFLSILQVHGFVAVPAGKVIKIVPDANVRQMPANDLPENVSSTSDEIVTQVIALKNVSAAQLVPILRPMSPQWAHMVAYQASNMLIITDRASNVSRLMSIIRRIDQQGDESVDLIQLQHASAAEVVRVVNSLYPPTGPEGGTSVKLVADERTNSVLVSGDGDRRLRLKALVTHLDTPLESGGDTQVRYLRYADAEKIATALKGQANVTAATATGGPQAAAGGPAAPAAAQAAQLDKNMTIWADPDTNALVITAPPKVMRSLMNIVDRLDIRRAQVQVEAIIVEVRSDKAADLGVNWVIDGSNDNKPVGGFIQDVNGADIGDVALAADNPAAAGVPNGFTVGVGRLADTGMNFAAMLRAFRSDGNTNIISTPSIVTMDNQEAEIKVAQEVPFLTGQYANTGVQGGNGGNNTVNPFQTIQRQEVGTILKITPQISDGDTVMLKIEQEASGLAQSSGNAVDLITNKRTITTTVLVEDGGVIVLGGLISDELREGEQRVPMLGSIPLIGQLFKVRNSSKVKTNLMVFIRPKILRDDAQTAIETGAKYDFLRQQQSQHGKGKVSLMPLEKPPLLPELTAPKGKQSKETKPAEEQQQPPGAAATTAPDVRPTAPAGKADPGATAPGSTVPPSTPSTPTPAPAPTPAPQTP